MTGERRPSVESAARDLTAGYGERMVIEDLGMELPGGVFTVIVGPNACGKSTLLRTLARLLRPRSGTALIDGAGVHAQPTRELARRLGVLPQGPVTPEGLSVADLVARGRQPYQRWFRQWDAEDTESVERALRLTGLDGLRDRPVDALSGGQRQRVWIAMTLAQDTDTLLLDEPATYLDLTHQVEVLNLLRLQVPPGEVLRRALQDRAHRVHRQGRQAVEGELPPRRRGGRQEGGRRRARQSSVRTSPVPRRSAPGWATRRS
ncbi:MAG: ATP-binding cassette domain-containing protein [Streptosporangiales bacterium]|nr:ATP-binding cassette domain-containing protein [Streptosporangiales bacterium]